MIVCVVQLSGDSQCEYNFVAALLSRATRILSDSRTHNSPVLTGNFKTDHTSVSTQDQVTGAGLRMTRVNEGTSCDIYICRFRSSFREASGPNSQLFDVLACHTIKSDTEGHLTAGDPELGQPLAEPTRYPTGKRAQVSLLIWLEVHSQLAQRDPRARSFD